MCVCVCVRVHVFVCVCLHNNSKRIWSGMLGPLCYKLITIVICYLETGLTCFVYCPKALYLFIFIVWLPLWLKLDIVVLRIGNVSRLFCSGEWPIEVFRPNKGMWPQPSSLYKEIVLAFLAHSSFSLWTVDKSIDWGQGKYTCHSKEIYYLLVINWQEIIWSYLIKAFDNKTWVDHFKETEIYRQWKKSLKFLIVDISQLWNLIRRQKNRRHCH